MDKKSMNNHTVNSDMMNSEKRGYLNSDFRIFHVRDKKAMDFKYHHHDFHKIVVFIRGKVTYHIEGKAYDLKPWDIVLVPNTKIHRPVIDENELYERIVFWFYPEFLERYSSKDSNLLKCFYKACEEDYYLMRLDEDNLFDLKRLLKSLEIAQSDKEFASEILKNVLFIEFIVLINRFFIYKEDIQVIKSNGRNDMVTDVISYINSNLKEDLSIDDIAANFYTSRYYIMHKFKQETGSTIYSYIIQKRLILAKSLIRLGLSMTEVAEKSGFKDYSTFVRAFKKSFYVSPREYMNSIEEIKNERIGNLDI